jgi:thiosulfate reductase cytochrome b subunit
MMNTSIADQHLVTGPAIGTSNTRAGGAVRHLAVVRITHWLIAGSAFGLLASGFGILISHPRLYWGETGAIGAPSLVDLPLPMIIGPSVWNRPIHFFFAWLLVSSALVYVLGGFTTKHFRQDLMPAQSDLKWTRVWSVVSDHLRWRRPSGDEAWTYNVVQRLIYLGVIFVLFPAIVWTGLAMSFGVTSVFPVLATLLGGHQSARTLHFVCAGLLVAYVIVHVAMIVLAGFKSHVSAMITGRIPKTGSTR